MSISISKITSHQSSTTPTRSQVKTSTMTSTKPLYPPYPDVILKKLPFYIVEDTLMKPSSLQPSGTAKKFHEQTFSFYMTPSQIKTVTNSKKTVNGRVEYRHQIQLRFSLLEISCEQSDAFPRSLCVRVNNKVCPLPNPLPSQPGTEPRRPPGPINITNLCKLVSTQQNTVTVTWATEVGKAHTVSVYQVENLTHQDLLEQLRSKGVRNPDYTKALIKEKLSDQDGEIATTSCKVSLACPLGKMRMQIPARASTCDHLQCFDAQLYLMMNEKKPKWDCPVCQKQAEPQKLQIDGFFLNLVRSSRLPPDEHEIVLHNDGSWDPLTSNKQQDRGSGRSRPKPKVESTINKVSAGTKRVLSKETITLEEITEVNQPSSKKAKTSSPVEEIECIDID